MRLDGNRDVEPDISHEYLTILPPFFLSGVAYDFGTQTGSCLCSIRFAASPSAIVALSPFCMAACKSHAKRPEYSQPCRPALAHG